MLVIRGAYIRGGLYSGGAYIRDFTVYSDVVCESFLLFLALSLFFQKMHPKNHAVTATFLMRILKIESKNKKKLLVTHEHVMLGY